MKKTQSFTEAFQLSISNLAERMRDVLSVSNLKSWATIAKMRTRQSAIVMTARYRSRFPEYLFEQEKNLIRAYAPQSESLISLAKKRHEEGKEKYGDEWAGRDPIVESREELADAYNYFQWAYQQNRITVGVRDFLLAKILELDHDLRLVTECPSSHKARRIKFYVPKGFVAKTTIGEDNEPGE